MRIIEYTIPWNEIKENRRPTEFGTIFIMPIKKPVSTDVQFGVFRWVNEPAENVLALGQFWNVENARIFAQAFEEESSPSVTLPKEEQ